MTGAGRSWHCAGMKKVGWAVLACGGCIVSAPGSQTPAQSPHPIVQFPSPAALAAVEAQPAQLPPVETADVPAEGWAVEPPDTEPSAGPDAWTPHGAWESAMAADFAAAGRKAQLTSSMGCVARELGRFQLAHRAAPPEALRQFIDASCGVYVPSVGFTWFGGQAPAQMSDEKILEQARAQIRPSLVDRIPADARQVGLWFGRQAGRLVAVASYESVPVTLQPLSTVPDAQGNVRIAGRLEVPAAAFDGYVNRGRFGVERCRVDPALVPPAFRITCPVAADDPTAWLQLVYTAPHSVLALPMVQVLARRDPGKLPRFVEVPYAASHPIADATGFAPAVVTELNAARAQAGLSPVRLSEPESAAAARVARQYFAGVTSNGGAPSGDTTTIVLGLMAGWQVQGMIRDGTFFSVLVPRTHDAGRWLDLALSLPLGRHALLARDIDEVALGPALFGSPEAIGGVACGYRLHHGDDHSADAAAVFHRVAEARARLGLSPPARLGGVAPFIARELGRVHQGSEPPYAAMQTALQYAAENSGARALRGYLVEATSTDAVDLPPKILSQPNMSIEIGVTHYKPPGAAWAQLVILIVYDAAATFEI
jgi:hypothetical protein